MKIKGRSSRSKVETALIEAKRVLNYIELDTQYTDGVLMFISPYHLEGALCFFHSYKHGNNWIRTAIIGGRLQKTAFKYDKRVDELFNELLESKTKEG